MLIKMVIIGAILLGGGVIFANEINQFLPETSVNLLDSVKNDFGKIKELFHSLPFELFLLTLRTTLVSF